MDLAVSWECCRWEFEGSGRDRDAQGRRFRCITTLSTRILPEVLGFLKRYPEHATPLVRGIANGFILRIF